MFKVEVESLEEYFSFDAKREPELRKLDRFLRKSAPKLKRYFHAGTPAGEPGMRFKMIGYGRSFSMSKGGKKIEWPIVGVALQKNYISVYFSVRRDDVALTDHYADRLGELRMGENNFSFVTFDNLDQLALAKLFKEAEQLYVNGQVV